MDMSAETRAMIEQIASAKVKEELSNGFGRWIQTAVDSIDSLDKKQDESLKHFDKKQDEILVHCNRLETRIEVLRTEMKIKSGVWGMVGSISAVVIILLVWYAQKVLVP